MIHHKLLRLSAILLLIGIVLSDIFQYLHPGGGPTYDETFANYARSSDWAAIHLAQFMGEAILLAGLLVLFFALNLTERAPRWLGFFGAISAGVALALAGVLYAIDGVALKQAVDAWATAPAAEQMSRLSSAEAIRWLEWGTNSYWNLMQGFALLLFAVVIVWTARVPRIIGFLMGLSGLAFFLVSWLVGTEGFTSATTLPNYAAYTFLFVLAIWLLIVALRRKAAVQVAIG